MSLSEVSNALFLQRLAPMVGIPVASILICFLPGWQLAGKFSKDEDLRTIVSCIISFGLVYLLTFAAYLLKVDSNFALVGLALVSIPALLEILRGKISSLSAPAHLLLLWLCATLLFVAGQIFIFAPGAPTGMWDWVEHWLRAKIFINGDSLTTKVGGYSMAARGPLFNAIAGFCMTAFKNQEYWVYQLVCTALNTWFVVPLFIGLRKFCTINIRWSVIFALLAGWLSYDLSWSIIYPWTKIVTAGIALGSLVLYFEGLKGDDARLMGFGLFGFSVAFLSHYYILPFTVFIWGHFALTRLRRTPRYWITAVSALGASAAFVSSWFLPSFAILGLKDTLASNTTLGTYYTNTASGVLPPYPKVFLYNLITAASPIDVTGILGIDSWVPKVANWISSGYVVHWTDGKQVYSEEVPFWFEKKFFSGVMGPYGAVGATVIIIILLYAMLRRIRPFSNLESPGKLFWMSFWTLCLMMNGVTSRDFGGPTLGWTHSMIILMAIFSVIYRAPRWLGLPALTILTTCGLNSIFRVIGIQSIPVALVNGQPQVGLNVKVFSWHIQNSVMKAQHKAVLLYDYLDDSKMQITVALLVITAATAAWLASKTDAATVTQRYL